MKKTITIYIISAFFGMLLPSCSKDVILPEMTEEEYPRIMGVWPEPTVTSDNAGNEIRTLGSQTARLGQEFVMQMMFTPSNLCEGVWYLDDIEYCRGTEFRFISNFPAQHNLKLVVKTPKYETRRELTLKVE